ncbi:MAG TPA: pyridoxamine 5'-phosphate oxidase family protein [Bacteroidales bacterium]|mgnify:FL=1|nr:pyridoxamine 5'-phosphate oxidase family protein [Bacteroidales bacterium]HPS26257.1 pyridoxamine 5'-phosphate oxidase family protein [Bacteroidales bacterium]
MRTKVLYEDLGKIEKILEKCDSCFVGMADENNQPYVVPYNFGFKDKCIYLHSGQKGKKMDILRKNNKVCVSFSTDHQLGWQHADVACSYLLRYRSVQAFGHVEFIEDDEEKMNAINIIMKKYTGRDFKYGMPSIKEVAVYKVVVDKIFGKEYGY